MKNLCLYLLSYIGINFLIGCQKLDDYPEKDIVDVYIVSHNNWNYFQFSTKEIKGNSVRNVKINNFNIWCTDLSPIKENQVDGKVIASHQQEQAYRLYFLDSKRLTASSYFDEKMDDIILQYLSYIKH